MIRKLKIIKEEGRILKSWTVLERKYRIGIIPSGKWKKVGIVFEPSPLSLEESVADYIKEYYQIRRMCDGHYIVYRRYYFFKWYYYAVDDRIITMFDTEGEAREAIVKSLVR